MYRIKQAGSIVLSALILSSCAQSESADLDAKKKKLGKYKVEVQELEQKIKNLEIEIASLEPSSNNGLKTRLVKVDTLQTSTFEHFIEVQGTVDSDENIYVSPEMNGVITSIYVKEGDKVTRGKSMAQLESGALTNSLQEARTALGLATTTYEKQKRLWDQNIGSEIQYLQAKTNMEAMQSRVKAIESQLNMTRIKSPISGTVDLVNVKLGEMASPGMSGIRVVNLDKMKVVAMISETYMTRVKKGDEVSINLPDAGLDLLAKVTFVSQVVNPANRSFKVEVALSNKDKVLKPNMIAKIKIKDEKLDNAMVVESNLIQRVGNQSYIMVAETQNSSIIARRREITTGMEYNGKTVVLMGISIGDLIIISGQNEIVDGQPLMF
ncbi:MAG: efflux RND transporter periplasmic adaptor subunit [Candidatus Competibacteraceae bacterium]|nr:efflux RND transporter periplasmic adaptor subunit [Candidatus Competibacteraceae bacterium]